MEVCGLVLVNIIKRKGCVLGRKEEKQIKKCWSKAKPSLTTPKLIKT